MYLTSIIGIIFGWFLGSAIAYRIVIMIENNTVYVRSPYPLGCAIASIITAVFTVSIIRVSLRKVKDLKLTDIKKETYWFDVIIQTNMFLFA